MKNSMVHTNLKMGAADIAWTSLLLKVDKWTVVLVLSLFPYSTFEYTMYVGENNKFVICHEHKKKIFCKYTAKLLFHQSPTRHRDYTVTTTVTM